MRRVFGITMWYYSPCDWYSRNAVLLWIKERWGETAGFRAAGHGTISYLFCLGPRRSGIFPAITPFRVLELRSITVLPAWCVVKSLCRSVWNYFERWHERQHKIILMDWIFFFSFFLDSNGQTLSANQKMAINRLSHNLSLTECFEMIWFKQLVFLKNYLVY